MKRADRRADHQLQSCGANGYDSGDRLSPVQHHDGFATPDGLQVLAEVGFQVSRAYLGHDYKIVNHDYYVNHGPHPATPTSPLLPPTRNKPAFPLVGTRLALHGPMILLLSLLACPVETACTELAAYSTTFSVTDADGRAVEGATGTYSVDGGEAKPCDSIVPGELMCGVEEAGAFRVEVSAAGFVTSVVVLDVASDECHVIGLASDLVLEESECAGEETPSAVVTVQAEDGTLLVDSVVTYAVDGGEAAACNPGGDSRHVCGYDDAGQFTLEASAFGFQTATVVVEVAGGECHAITESVTMTLASNECSDKHVPAVIVNLSDAGGAELSSPAVTFIQNASAVVEACNDQGSGLWWCGNTIGDYVITASADGHEAQSESFAIVSDAEGCHPLTQSTDIALQWLPD